MRDRLAAFASHLASRLDWLTCLLIALAVGQVALSMAPANSRITEAGAVLTTFCLGFAVGTRLTANDMSATLLPPLLAMRDAFASTPANVMIKKDEDGCSALIQRMDGEPVVVRIPDEVAEEGPQAAVAWALDHMYGAD